MESGACPAHGRSDRPIGRVSVASIILSSDRTERRPPSEPLASAELPATGRCDMDWKLEVVVVPVSDVDRSKAFYSEQCGFVVDVDHPPSEAFRVVQLTPPGSACSVTIGKGLADMAPGSLKGLQLVVADVEAARAELAARGVDVSRSSTSRTASWPTAMAGPGTRSASSTIPTATAGRSRRSRHRNPERRQGPPVRQAPMISVAGHSKTGPPPAGRRRRRPRRSSRRSAAGRGRGRWPGARRRPR